jgi:hypothetical protein
MVTYIPARGTGLFKSVYMTLIAVFLISVFPDISTGRFDGLRWRNKGSVQMPKSCAQLRQTRPQLRRTQYGLGDSNLFVYQQLTGCSPLVVLQYVHVPPVAVAPPMASAEDRRSVRDIFSGNPAAQPQRVYQEQRLGDGNPRNLRQVQNIKAKLTRERKIADCHFEAIKVLQNILGAEIASVQLTHDDFSIVVVPQTLPDLVKVAIEACMEVYLLYDTTFDFGDFYLSVLLAKLPLFLSSSGAIPVVPLAFHVHHLKRSSTHGHFFHVVGDVLPFLRLYTLVIVMDREAAFRVAIRQELPNWLIASCWNHLQQNLRFRLNSLGAPDSEVRQYLRDLQELLQCGSVDDLNRTFLRMKATWCVEVQEYMENSVLDDLRTSASVAALREMRFPVQEKGMDPNAYN